MPWRCGGGSRQPSSPASWASAALRCIAGSPWPRRLRRPWPPGPIPTPGPRPRLGDEQLRELERLLLEGARAHGWPNDLWSAGRVAGLVRRRFGVGYHAEHVRKILRRRLAGAPDGRRRGPGNAIGSGSTAEGPRSSPASSKRLASGRPTWSSWTNRASSSRRRSAAPTPRGAGRRSSRRGIAAGGSRRSAP